MLSRGIPWNIPLVTLGSCVYRENISDKSDIPRYTTRKRYITSMSMKLFVVPNED